MFLFIIFEFYKTLKLYKTPKKQKKKKNMSKTMFKKSIDVVVVPKCKQLNIKGQILSATKDFIREVKHNIEKNS